MYQPSYLTEREEYEEEYHLCTCSKNCDNFKESEMVYDDESNDWIAKKCVPYHLKNIKGSISKMEFVNYSRKLNKQIEECITK